ncbi:hypothetical protein BGAL_0491g00020 [Botrytis galanthina]|uniref:Uncharacterized protein n=1 Tax=Botrytis galanthina TaxID=278940 RepID=A0A4S8QLF6_9HELO|nr:hypothetical protein BGAL_0491g00020 [Botrytis galanthina]
MYPPNFTSNQFHLNNCLFKYTNIPLDFSRPLPPPPSSPPRPPPPLSYLAGHNLPLSVPELNEDTVFRASLDGHLDDIHYPANTIPAPRSSTATPQISRHIISSPSPTSPSHQPQLTMSSPQFSRSATSPDLSTPQTISPIPELQEYTPNCNGAISRTDRYSRVLPTIPPHPSTPPPPIPTIPSSSSNLFNTARPSGLRHVTFAHETDNLSLTSSHLSQTSSIPSSSLPTETPRKHRFNLTLAHQKMQKAFSTLRTHTHSISPKPSLLLRKKSSHSTLFGAGSSPLSTSAVSTDEPTRPKTAPSSSSSSGFGSFPTMQGAFSKDSKNGKTGAGREMQIGAPTGMVKKTPEEIHQMLREMGVKSEDLPFVSSASASTVRASSHSHFAGDDNTNTHTGTSPSQSQSQSTSQEPHTSHSPRPETPRALSAIQRGKLPALSYPFTRPLRSSSLSTPHHSPDVPFPVRDLTKKPVGWYSTASLDEIRATLPPTRKEDLLKNDEIDGFLEGAGVGARWFVFDDTENILGGPKCPITHAVDGFEDEELEQGLGVELDREGGDREGEIVGYNADVDVEGTREEMRATLLSPIEEGFGEGEEEFDEDARQLTQEEILRREGLL